MVILRSWAEIATAAAASQRWWASINRSSSSRSLALGSARDLSFSSRRRHTIFDCDWSSDVCSSDLQTPYPYTMHCVGVPSIPPAVCPSYDNWTTVFDLGTDPVLGKNRSSTAGDLYGSVS